MLSRRDTLRLAGLAALATTVASLGACGPDPATGKTGAMDLVSSDVRRRPADVGAIPPVAEALHGLAGGLYGALAGQAGNLALSPYSIAVALAMTANGAAGTTADEMAWVLGLRGDLDLAAYNAGLGSLTQAVEALAGSFPRGDDDPAVIALDSANALFGDRSTTWRPAFLDTLAASYGAGMRVVDYVGDIEGARQAVNAWTAEQTHDKIPEILPQGVVDAMTRLVLVNALYFKAPWATEFEPSQTADGPFRLEGGDTVDVPMMHGEVRGAGHGRGPGLTAVRLPYYGNTLAMTILVPDDGRLADVEASVAAGGLGELLAVADMADVRLMLPRWTFRSKTALDAVLSDLGMPTAFTDQADFGPMTDDGTDLFISAVLHQTYVAVDEHGTEAAAATAVGMQVTSMPQYVDVVVDRPFLFVIHDVEHGTPLFLGRVADPRS